MAAWYNEIDEYAAQWLRNLIAHSLIAPGDVDTRSIEDVSPDDLRPYQQCHFFAGIGVWSYALRLAGWSDERAVWTGSCPCQPFSSAGKGIGFADERHLWPSWFYLINRCRPANLFGEQVASKAAEPWLDLVQDDMEGVGYAFGAVPFPAAGVGAPHMRDRTYWMAHHHHQGLEGWGQPECERAAERAARSRSLVGELAIDTRERCGEARGEHRGRPAQRAGDSGTDGGVADDEGRGLGVVRGTAQPGRVRHVDGGSDALGRLAHDAGGRTPASQQSRQLGIIERGSEAPVAGTGPTNGFWRDVDWLHCRDGKWRPVEPGTFPLAHGAAARVGRLRGYGNAIVAEAAAEFIQAAMSCMP